VGKKKRSKVKYPNLDPKMNLKKRQFYMDNHYYVKRLPEEAKEFLNAFNGEYYNASFKGKSWSYDDIHELKIDKASVDDIKGQIKVIKAARKKIYNKSPNTTTDADRDLCGFYTDQIDEMEDFLDKVHPRRELERNNYARNEDIINHGRASNEINIVSWETLDDNMIGAIDPELWIQQFDEDED
jgi:hypothetical protein